MWVGVCVCGWGGGGDRQGAAQWGRSSTRCTQRVCVGKEKTNEEEAREGDWDSTEEVVSVVCAAGAKAANGGPAFFVCLWQRSRRRAADWTEEARETWAPQPHRPRSALQRRRLASLFCCERGQARHRPTQDTRARTHGEKLQHALLLGGPHCRSPHRVSVDRTAFRPLPWRPRCQPARPQPAPAPPSRSARARTRSARPSGRCAAPRPGRARRGS